MAVVMAGRDRPCKDTGSGSDRQNQEEQKEGRLALSAMSKVAMTDGQAYD